MELLLARHRGDLLCVGGPARGRLVEDGGLPAVRIPCVRRGTTEPVMVTYERRILNAETVILTLPGATVEQVTAELLAHYRPHHSAKQDWPDGV
jgi:transposase-like protein